MSFHYTITSDDFIDITEHELSEHDCILKVSEIRSRSIALLYNSSVCEGNEVQGVTEADQQGVTQAQLQVNGLQGVCLLEGRTKAAHRHKGVDSGKPKVGRSELGVELQIERLHEQSQQQWIPGTRH